VSGEQWPLFLYMDLACDPEDAWNGLMRSQLLVMVCILTCLCLYHFIFHFSNVKGINTSSPFQAPLMMMSQRLRGQEMLASMA